MSTPEMSAEPEAGGRKRKSCAGRKLMRWDPQVDQLVLLSIDKVCVEQGIAIPWDLVAKEVRPDHLSGEAIKQHLVKLRAGRITAGQAVPDKIGKTARRMASISENHVATAQQPKSTKAKPTIEGDDNAGEMKAANLPKTSSLIYVRPEKPNKRARKGELADKAQTGTPVPKPSKRGRRAPKALPEDSESETKVDPKKPRRAYALRDVPKPDYREVKAVEDEIPDEPRIIGQHDKQMADTNTTLKLEMDGNGNANLASAGSGGLTAMAFDRPNGMNMFFGASGPNGPSGTSLTSSNFGFGSMTSGFHGFHGIDSALAMTHGQIMPYNTQNFSMAAPASSFATAQQNHGHGYVSGADAHSAYASPDSIVGQQGWNFPNMAAVMQQQSHKKPSYSGWNETPSSSMPFTPAMVPRNTPAQSSGNILQQEWTDTPCPSMPFTPAMVPRKTPAQSSGNVSQQEWTDTSCPSAPFTPAMMHLGTPAQRSGNDPQQISPVSADGSYKLNGTGAGYSDICNSDDLNDTPIQDTLPRSLPSLQDSAHPTPLPSKDMDHLLDLEHEFLPMSAFHLSSPILDTSFDNLGDPE